MNVTTQASTLESMQALMVQMQKSLQHQVQQQQQQHQQLLQQQQLDFQVRMEQLLVGKGKGVEFPSASVTNGPLASLAQAVKTPLASHSSLNQAPEIDENLIGIASNEPLQNSPELGRPTSRTRHSQYTTSHTKIKASDLPKFGGDKGEDVGVWIGQLSAIFDANNCTNSEIVAFLSVILKDTALKWFTRLGPKGRSQFLTWIHWQEAIRQRFLNANYLAEKKRLWKKRDLRDNVDMANYFYAKVDLQAFVFEEDTPGSKLIFDILDGLPDYMLPTLKSSISPDMDLLDFKRILLEYEKGLRWKGPWSSRRQGNNTVARSNNSTYDRSKPSPSAKYKDTSKPRPRACSCGGMHWYIDCPKKATKSNVVSSFRPSPNRIPVHRSSSKWPTYNSGTKPNAQRKFERKEGRMNSVRLDNDVIEIGLPEQGNDGFDDINNALCNKESLCNNIQSKDSSLQNRHSGKVPTIHL
ncbi:hypothetical protein QFC20_006513 [Naganishia adeliensis]|uniref:Uncharacterized protein n=1 Tax=Naganishia adeliensis TaxID=92952 RepID=A0ACC2VC43_9TREE|nr:hypothetical protein QFC20_006513 [Naganishia adeliensis]